MVVSMSTYRHYSGWITRRPAGTKLSLLPRLSLVGGLRDLFAYLKENQPRHCPLVFKFLSGRTFQDFIHLVVIGCYRLGLREDKTQEPPAPIGSFEPRILLKLSDWRVVQVVYLRTQILGEVLLQDLQPTRFTDAGIVLLKDVTCSPSHDQTLVMDGVVLGCQG